MNKIDVIVSLVKSLTPGSNIRRVFKKLGTDKNGVPYHLPLLNLYFDDNEELTIKKFKDLALNLKDSPRIIRSLIRDVNWRPALVGNTVVILLRAKEFQKDLIWRLENGNWVAPQLAVGIALLNDGLAEKELQRIIQDASEESNPKTIMSAYSALKFLESKTANEFEQTKLFEVLKEKDAWDNSFKIAEEHWDYWKNIEPINQK